MIPVTGLLIVKNEAEFIERALASLLWCNEILVIDSFSTDDTPIICRDPSKPWAQKIRFMEKSWLGFSEQRNFALSQARNDWVFFLDGDEECSPELALKIQSLLSDSAIKPSQYRVRRQEFFLKKPIHHGIWNPSFHIRFFYKRGLSFQGTVHEGVQSPFETLQINEPIIHVEDLRIERFMNKLNHYTTLQAQNDFERGMRTHLLRILLSFPAMFYKNYIYYGAWKDGVEGFIISVLEGISRTVRHLKIWQLSRISKTKH